MKWTLLDFSFSFVLFCFLKQKIVAAEELENEKEVVSVEDDGREAEDVLSGASVLVPPVSKSSNFVVSQALSFLTFQATNFFTWKCSICSH